ncbi:hypothetical protein BOTBODRAFT_174088 [Botryobasidium botryosum FD-172 SS1]|uniref:Uncharacterized protein n=1 Tax=Botryobasidium botryosum (strain FD-172 SS1) TaxID=930990 RepID=A0A067MTP6_BOTB1|nr:hypothetical protein BOTBODRAFT_174088 [Botryobasidium botryosum FD-172 SS1]
MSRDIPQSPDPHPSPLILPLLLVPAGVTRVVDPNCANLSCQPQVPRPAQSLSCPPLLVICPPKLPPQPPSVQSKSKLSNNDKHRGQYDSQRDDLAAPEFNLVDPGEVLSVPSQATGVSKTRAQCRKWDLTTEENAWLSNKLKGFKDRLTSKDHTAATWWKQHVILAFLQKFPWSEGTDLIEEQQALLNWAKNYKSRQEHGGPDATSTSLGRTMVFKKLHKASAIELFAEDHKQEVDTLRKQKRADWAKAGDPLAAHGGRAWQIAAKELFGELTPEEQQEYKSKASVQSTMGGEEDIKEKNVEYFAEMMNRYLQKLQANLPWAAISVSAGIPSDNDFRVDAPPPKFQDFASWDKKWFDAHQDDFSEYCIKAYNTYKAILQDSNRVLERPSLPPLTGFKDEQFQSQMKKFIEDTWDFVRSAFKKTPLDWESLSASPTDFLTSSSLPEDVTLQDPEQMDPLEVMTVYRHIYRRQDKNPSVFNFLPQYYTEAPEHVDKGKFLHF